MLSIKDHIIISKYGFEFYKLNLNFKRNYHPTLFFDKTKATKIFLNGFFVSPNYLNIYSLVNIIKAGRIYTITSQKKLEDYVSLTRVSFHPVIKTWCDWCAMCNGYLEFLVDAINDYYKINHLDSIERGNLYLIKLKLMIATLRYLKLFAKKEISQLKKPPELTEADLFPYLYTIAPQHILKLLALLTKMYNVFQEVEHLWCPFEYMKRISSLAKNHPERYAYYYKCDDFSDVLKAGEILFNFRHIKCHQCVHVLNEGLGTSPPSPLQEKTEAYFKLICSLSR